MATNDGPAPDRVAVVHNPTKVDLDQLRPVVDEAAERYSFAPTLWLETSEDDPGTAMARDAIEQGATVVLAAGGDGTVRAVAQGLRGTGTTLAILPRGTGNLLARTIGVPLNDTTEAVRLAFAGERRDIDAGVATVVRPGDGHDGAEEHVFAVMAGIGLDAQMIVNQDEGLKKRAGWLAYLTSLALSLKGGRRIRARYGVDDGSPRTTRVHTLLIGNCGDLPANVVLLPDAEIDDGQLDMVALRPDGLLGWLTIWSKVLVEHAILRRSEVGRKLVGDRDGRPRHIRALRYLRGRRIRVQLREPEEFELDGDTFGEVSEFVVEVDPGALSVRVPD